MFCDDALCWGSVEGKPRHEKTATPLKQPRNPWRCWTPWDNTLPSYGAALQSPAERHDPRHRPKSAGRTAACIQLPKQTPLHTLTQTHTHSQIYPHGHTCSIYKTYLTQTHSHIYLDTQRNTITNVHWACTLIHRQRHPHIPHSLWHTHTHSHILKHLAHTHATDTNTHS